MVGYLDGVAGLVERSEVYIVFDVLLDRSEVIEIFLLGRVAREHMERGGAETAHGMRLSGVDRVERDFVDLFRGDGFVVETSEIESGRHSVPQEGSMTREEGFQRENTKRFGNIELLVVFVVAVDSIDF